MQLPKNIMQIGTVGEYYRVYMEDYVYTYIRQYEQDKRKIYLFGLQEYSQDELFLYIYGAADHNKGILNLQHEFFSDYEIIGVMTLFHNEKEISLQNGITFHLNGFFVFYEQNPAMQSFLIFNYQQTVKEQKELPEKKRLEQMEQTRNTKTKQPIHETDFLYAASYGMAIVICVIAIMAINRYDKLQGFGQEFLQVGNWKTNQETEPILEESLEESSEVLFNIEETCVEDIQKEVVVESEETTASSEEEICSEYEVKKGDSLLKICREKYGNDEKLKEICSLNRIDDPDDIRQGQKILLP